MAQPAPYDRQANFSNEEALNPTTKTPGASLDAEFNAAKISLDQTQANLALIQRDDGRLANASVGIDQIAPSLSIGFTLRGSWEAPESYVLGDGVVYDSGFWRAAVSHVSELGSPPAASNPLWEFLYSITDIVPVVIPDGSVTDAKLRNSAGVSVIGRAVNSTGGPADIAAAADDTLLQRKAGALIFDKVGTALLEANVLSADAAGRGKMADGFLSVDAAGRAKMADGYLSADATGQAKMANGFLSADATGQAKMANGFLSVDATGRAKMADGYLSADATGRAKMADGFVTAAQMAAAAKAFLLPANIGVSASVASNALTINLLDAAGNTPTALSPCIVPFRSATPATGTISTLEVSAAASLVISSGSTLGTANGFAFNLYLVAFNDGGTFRLGVIQCANGATTTVAKLAARGIASSTAEGGAGAADTFNTFYTGTAVTAKAYQVLARMEFNSGQATAGTWATAPDKIEVYEPGFWLPGDVVDRKRNVNTAFGTYAAGIPLDDTVPGNTEGTEVIATTAIVAKTGASRFKGVAIANTVQLTSGAVAVGAVIHNLTGAAIAAATLAQASTSNGFGGSVIEFEHAPGSGTHVYRLRIGANSGDIAHGGTNAARLFGGVNQAVSIRVEEIMG